MALRGRTPSHPQDYNYNQLVSYRIVALQELEKPAAIAGITIERDKLGISILVRTDTDERSVDLLFTGDPDGN